MMPTKTAQNLRDTYMPLLSQAKFAEMIELCDQAYFEADLEGDQVLAAVALTGLSYAYEMNGDYEQCISYAHRALEAAEASKDKRTLCDALCEVAGSEAQILGRIDASIERFTQALALAEDAEYTLGLAKALHGLGNMHRLRRQMPKAQARLQEALKYGKGAGDNHQLTMIHNTLANYYLGNNQPHKALGEYEHALKYCRINGDRLNETTILANMGLANTQRLGLDAYRTAFQYFDQALAVAREIKFVYGQLAALGGMGESNIQLMDYEKALSYYEEAYTLADNHQIAVMKGLILDGKIRVFQGLKQYDQAALMCQQLIEVARRAEDYVEVADKTLGLALIYRMMGRFSQVYRYYGEALKVCRQHKIPKQLTYWVLIVWWTLIDLPRILIWAIFRRN